jgi:nicotinamide mononucleotide transporter
MIETIIAYFAGPLGLVELFGTIFSAICVYLAIKHNMWTWFFGALGVILFGYLFLQFGLYSDAGLQILFFLPMQLIGFIMWRRAANKAENKSVVLSLTLVQFALIGIGILGAAGLNGYLIATLTTGASFPYIDALTTWMSIAAQLLMIAKYRESWILWVAMDVIAIFVYYAKGLIVTSGLYVLFLVLATFGGIAWYRDYAKQNNVTASSIPLVRNK